MFLITHYSSWSGETTETEIMERFEQNLLHFVRGEPLLGEADPARGY